MIEDRLILCLKQKQEVDQDTDTDAFCSQVLMDRWDIIGHDCGVSNMRQAGMLQDYKTSEQKLRLQKTAAFCEGPISDRFFAPIAHQKTLSGVL